MPELTPKEQPTVLHIARGFTDYMVGLLNAMAELTPTHVALARADEGMSGMLGSAVHVLKTGAPRVSRSANLLSIRALACYIRKVRPDVIHFQGGVLWELLLLPFIRRTTIVTTIHDVTPHSSVGATGARLSQLGTERMTARADGIIVHGELLRAIAIEKYRRQTKPERIFVVPHGVIDRYGTGRARTEIPQGGNILVFGSLDIYKGIEYLIAAEPKIRQRVPGIHIRIAGAPGSPAYADSLARLSGNIELRLRRQNDTEVSELFRWADVIVLPYIDASQSGVLQLALSFGLPPVVSSAGSLAEVISNGRNGLVVPPRDVAALEDAIVRLLTDFPLRARVIDHLVADRQTRFSWPMIARQTIAIYDTLQNLRHGNSP